MNPYFRENRNFCLFVFVLFCFVFFLCPAFANDYPQESSLASSQSLKKVDLNNKIPKSEQDTQLPDHKPKKPDQGQQLPDHKPKKPDQGQQLPDQKPKKPDHGQQLPDHKPKKPDHGQQLPDQKPKKPDQGQQLPDHKPKKPDQGQQLPDHKPKKPDQGQQLPDYHPKKPDQETQLPGHKGEKLEPKGKKLEPKGKKLEPKGKKPEPKGDKLDQKDKKPEQQKQTAEKLKPGDIGLQISNETDFALAVRVSIVDASERVNLAKAKSVSLAAKAKESVVLSPMNSGKVSLKPKSEKKEISKDSKVLLTISKGKETRRLVVGYGKSGGTIVIGKDLFPDAQEKDSHSKLPKKPSEESEKQDKKESFSEKGHAVYIVNNTGAPVSYNAFLKPDLFEHVQGELKPGTNVLKFVPRKKVSNLTAKMKISLIMQLKYNSSGSSMVTFKKESLDLDSKPTVEFNKSVMGEPLEQTPTKKKLK